jgi:hypothetical protein
MDVKPSLKEAIIAFLQGQDRPVTEPAIKRGVIGDNRYKQDALRALVKDGQVARQGRGTRGHPFTFSLAHVSPRATGESEHAHSGLTPETHTSYAHFTETPFVMNGEGVSCEHRAREEPPLLSTDPCRCGGSGWFLGPDGWERCRSHPAR